MAYLAKFLLLAALLCGAAIAQTSTRAQRAERLAEVLGIAAEIEATKQASRARSEEQLAKMLEQVQTAKLPPEVLAEFRQFTQDYMRKVGASWDSNEAARVYAAALAEGMSDAELDEAIAYYSTPAGQKANRTVASAGDRLTEYVLSRTAPVEEAEMKRFLERVIELRDRAARRAKDK